MRQNLARISPKMRQNFFGKDQFPCNDWVCLLFPNHLERCGTLLQFHLLTAPLLRPTDARCGRLNDEHLARSCSACHARSTTPLGCHQEQRPLVSASECASEATTIQVDRLQYLATFANTHATLVGDIAVPDGVYGVQANAVRGAVAKVSPYPPVRQAAVGRNVEGCESFAVGLRKDQRCVVGCHHHAIWECDTICYLPGRAIRGDQSDDPGGELAAWKVKADVVEVGVAPTVHDDLVPGVVREAGQVGMGYKRPIGLPAQEKSIAPRDDQQRTRSKVRTDVPHILIILHAFALCHWSRECKSQH